MRWTRDCSWCRSSWRLKGYHPLWAHLRRSEQYPTFLSHHQGRALQEVASVHQHSIIIDDKIIDYEIKKSLFTEPFSYSELWRLCLNFCLQNYASNCHLCIFYQFGTGRFLVWGLDQRLQESRTVGKIDSRQAIRSGMNFVSDTNITKSLLLFL